MIEMLTPMLAVESVERSRDFYRDVLGFTCDGDFRHEGRIVWCHLTGPVAPGSGERARVMVTSKPIGPDGDRQTRKGVILYMYAADVEALHAQMGARASVSALRDTVYGMREFELEDPDGYQIWFGRTIEDSPTDKGAAADG